MDDQGITYDTVVAKKLEIENVKLKRVLARMTKERNGFKETAEHHWAQGKEARAILQMQIKSLSGQLAEAQAQKADVERAYKRVIIDLRAEVDGRDIEMRDEQRVHGDTRVRAELAEARLARYATVHSEQREKNGEDENG